MNIRCPHCEFVRQVNERSIPPTAELATCPKCKQRFRFRTVESTADSPQPDETPPRRTPARHVPAEGSPSPENTPALDIWDAVDSLHSRWQKQLDEHVTEVHTPEIPELAAEQSREPSVPPATQAQPARQPAQVQPVKAESTQAQYGTIQASKPRSGNPAASTSSLSHDATQLYGVIPPVPPPAGRQIPVAAPPYTDQHTYQEQGTVAAQVTPPPSSNQAEQPPAGCQRVVGTGPSAAFPYTNDTTPPEKRVEHDMKLLLSSPTRPVKDLGKLEEFTPSEEEEELAFGAEIGSVPWESPDKHGWIKSFVETTRGVMFNAPNFFQTISQTGSLSPAFLFFLIFGYLAIGCTILWSNTIALVFGQPQLTGNLGNILFMLLLAPVALGLMLVLAGGGTRLALELFCGQRIPFALVCKIICYALAPFVLSIIPFIGPLAGIIWFFIVLTIACHKVFSLSWAYAALATIPAGITLAGGLFLFFF